MSTAAKARTTDPITSHLAAAGVDTATHRVRVLAILRTIGPATDEEMVAEHNRLVIVSGWPRASASSLRSRRATLVRDGLVEAVVDPTARTTLGGHTLRWRVVPEP